MKQIKKSLTALLLTAFIITAGITVIPPDTNAPSNTTSEETCETDYDISPLHDDGGLKADS